MSCVIYAQVVRARDGLGFEKYLVGGAVDDVLTVGRAMDGLVCKQCLVDWWDDALAACGVLFSCFCRNVSVVDGRR